MGTEAQADKTTSRLRAGRKDTAAPAEGDGGTGGGDDEVKLLKDQLATSRKLHDSLLGYAVHLLKEKGHVKQAEELLANEPVFIGKFESQRS